MIVTSKTRKSHYWNEDRFIIGNKFFMVIDGATPLIKHKDFNSACWLVDFIKKNINKYDGDIEKRLYELSKEGYSKLPIEDKSSDYIPSASLCYVEYDDEFFHIGVLGDCEVTCITKDNVSLRYFNDDLSKLDDKSINELKNIAKVKNIHTSLARPYIKDTLIKHRKMINQKGGYKAFTLSPDPYIKPDVYSIKKSDVKELYLYSDGFSQAFEFLNIYNNHAEMFAQSLDIEEEINKIKIASFNDPYCDKYPRLKKIDDITIIKVINN